MIKGLRSKHGQTNQAKPLLGMGAWDLVTPCAGAVQTGRLCTAQPWGGCGHIMWTLQVHTFIMTMLRGLVPIKSIFYDNFLTHGGQYCEDRPLFLIYVKQPHSGNPGRWVWLRSATSHASPKFMSTKNLWLCDGWTSRYSSVIKTPLPASRLRTGVWAKCLPGQMDLAPTRECLSSFQRHRASDALPSWGHEREVLCCGSPALKTGFIKQLSEQVAGQKGPFLPPEPWFQCHWVTER